MLSELAIKNFAIIDDIRIQFKDGLTVLTGETGAGKSIIIEAVNLILGSRASHDIIRTGHENAELEACFDIDPESYQAKLMDEQGIDLEEGLMIRRIISSTGRHKVFINSRQSSMQLLKDLTENLHIPDFAEYIILINGKRADENTLLNNNDTIVVFSPVAGG